MAERPSSSAPPDSSDSLAPRAGGGERVPRHPARVRLANTLTAMNAEGDDAEELYQGSLEQLREHPEMVMVEISRAEAETDPGAYPDRLALIQIAGELRHPAALPFLSNVVLTPIPPERSTHPHSFSTVAEETILRTTAVDAVGELAKQDNREAADILFEFLKQPSLSVRRAAVQSILATDPTDDLRERIAALLPEEHQFLLDIRPISVAEVEQIKDPTRHLSREARHSKVEPPPDLPGSDPRGETRSESPPTTRDD
jgi:hypothetical protein